MLGGDRRCLQLKELNPPPYRGLDSKQKTAFDL